MDSTIGSLERGLHMSTAKNKAISQNIANVDTPHYKAKRVIFKDVLEQQKADIFQAKRTHEKHKPFSSNNHGHNVIENRHTLYNHNGNNVDMDHEMSTLAENQIYYNSLVDRFNGKMQSLQTVIRGGN